MEIKALSPNRIINFWEWFSTNYKNFGESFENEELLGELDRLITGLGNFAWELGPGIQAANMLIVSPGGQIELLSQTKEIVSYAPNIEDWEFHYAKPQKQWDDFIFDIYRDNGEKVEINASSWRYALLKYNDGMFGIIIKADLTELTTEEQITAAEILLDGVLGEEKRILTIAEIEVVTEFEEQYVNKGNDIKTLAEHITKLNNHN
ncbi:hypothetical protein B0I27_1168 [Arcticibacter pallidicorallinus]|uniref:Uncharacterized protein n=1 Tax=Arcticibacter pallidicorallinus TaxID=1259464 RepID=A0A2T0TQS2_9SPHI|nr:hypothetical protein [Arcticibacter pallidicorallinus]PRY48074.1 hypothetical protein B0I27_1168 [Arcticibacter pallidicorallinus]